MNLVDLFKKGLKCYLRQEYTFHNNLDIDWGDVNESKNNKI